jgi:hypothetical protein
MADLKEQRICIQFSFRIEEEAYGHNEKRKNVFCDNAMT